MHPTPFLAWFGLILMNLIAISFVTTNRFNLNPQLILRNRYAGLLKDYLRELPEPLFTKALFEMMVDGLSVCLPDDPNGNAKLMCSILECLPKSCRVSVEWFKIIDFKHKFINLRFSFCSFLAGCFSNAVHRHVLDGSSETRASTFRSQQNDLPSIGRHLRSSVHLFRVRVEFAQNDRSVQVFDWNLAKQTKYVEEGHSAVHLSMWTARIHTVEFTAAIFGL